METVLPGLEAEVEAAALAAVIPEAQEGVRNLAGIPPAPTTIAEAHARQAEVDFTRLSAEDIVELLEREAELPVPEGAEVKPRFQIDSQGKVEWLYRKDAALQAELDLVTAGLKEQERSLKGSLKRLRDYFVPQVEQFVQDRLAELGPKVKTLKTAVGSFGFQNRSGGDLKVSQPEVTLEWARKNAPELIRVVTNEVFHENALEAYLQRTGEVPPGCFVTEDKTVMYRRTPKKAGEA